MSTETVAEKVARLAKEKGLPRDTIVSAIYAGLSESEISAADADTLIFLRPRQHRERKPAEHATTAVPKATPVAVKQQPIRM